MGEFYGAYQFCSWRRLVSYSPSLISQAFFIVLLLCFIFAGLFVVLSFKGGDSFLLLSHSPKAQHADF